MRLPILYPITDRAAAGGLPHDDIVRLLVAGGASLIQIREKEMSDADLASAAAACVAVAGARIVVNDRPDVAKVTRAAGVHLGDDDLPAPDARAILGRRAVVGVSTHSIEEAVAACSLPVDYVALGPVFESGVKRGSRVPLGVDAVARASARMKKPLVAIGGITLATAPGLLAAGAASVAVITDVMAASDIPARVRAYLALVRPRR